MKQPDIILKNNIQLDLYEGDCLEIMGQLPDKSINMVLCDLPYGATSMKWDSPINNVELWKQYNRICNGYVVLFSAGLFTYNLIGSNSSQFKYKLIWKKNVPTGMSSAKYRPMKYYEEICIFAVGGKCIYNPQMKPRIGVGKACYNYEHYCGDNNHIKLDKVKKRYDPDFVQPSDVLEFNVVPNRNGKLHPTQKPVDLCEYLIKTYTNEGDIVLDNCMGAGSTGIAALNTNRSFIGMEIDQNYYEIAKNRIENAANNL